MAEAVPFPSSSAPSSSSLVHAKPVFVRVKRKASQAKLEAFWLEINERPLKRPLLDFAGLSISDSAGKVQEESKTKKLLVQHVETLSHSDAIKEALQSLLPDSVGSEDVIKKIDKRKSKQYKPKQDLRSVARQKHEDLARSARFHQIWKSRRGNKEEDDNPLRELCHLYDVVRVDNEDEKSQKAQEPEDVSVDENAILCNYLPFLRECLPTAAEEIESEIFSYFHRENKYVYDLYTVEDGMDICEEEAFEYPLVQVQENDDDYCEGHLQSEYESADSNDEDNPRNDYPDEESTKDNESGDEDSFDDSEGSDSQYEHELEEFDEEN